MSSFGLDVSTIFFENGGILYDTAGRIIVDATRLQSPNYVSQTSGWGIDSNGSGDFRYLFADELHAKSFIADLEQALAGGQIIAKSVTLLGQAFTMPATGTLQGILVRDLPSAPGMPVFQNGDYVMFRTFSRSGGSLTIAEAIGTVADYADDDNGLQYWNWTRRPGSDGGNMAAGTVIPVDSLAIDFGVTGNGYYEVNAVDGVYGINSPYAQTVTWSGTSPIAANRAVRARFGNLRGITGIDNEFGLIAGVGFAATNGRFVRLSNTAVELHGVNLRLWDGSTNTFLMDHGVPSFAIGSPVPSAFGTGTGIWMGKTGSVYAFRVGNPSGDRLSWDGSELRVVSTNLTVDNNGIRIAPDTTFQDVRAYRWANPANDARLFGTYGFSSVSGGTSSKETSLTSRNLNSNTATRTADATMSAQHTTTGGAVSRVQAHASTSVGHFVLLEAVNTSSVSSQAQLSVGQFSINSGTTVRFAQYGAGTATFDASGNITSSSDERLKEKVKAFKPGLDAVLSLEPITFQWNKKSGLDREHRYTGFIAQDVKKAIPDAVGEDSSGLLTLSDRAIIAALVNAVKEQQQTIESLQHEVNTLRGKR